MWWGIEVQVAQNIHKFWNVFLKDNLMLKVYNKNLS